jgi:hypothetical protein
MKHFRLRAKAKYLRRVERASVRSLLRRKGISVRPERFTNAPKTLRLDRVQII